MHETSKLFKLEANVIFPKKAPRPAMYKVPTDHVPVFVPEDFLKTT